jgi:hypothetical protein
MQPIDHQPVCFALLQAQSNYLCGWAIMYSKTGRVSAPFFLSASSFCCKASLSLIAFSNLRRSLNSALLVSG